VAECPVEIAGRTAVTGLAPVTTRTLETVLAGGVTVVEPGPHPANAAPPSMAATKSFIDRVRTAPPWRAFRTYTFSNVAGIGSTCTPAASMMIRGSFFAFVSTVLGASAMLGAERPTASAAAAWTPPYFPILLRGEYDYDAMMHALPTDAAHKQVFLSNPSMLTAPGVAGIFQKMSLAMTCYEFALERGQRLALAMAAVLIAEPVVFALNDAMWRKYRIAATFSLRDRTGQIGTRNFTRKAWSDLNLDASPNSPTGIYHDFTSEALRKRGAGFLVCHNALAGVSARFALRSGASHAAVLKEWTANLLPGFVAVPSGAQAVQVAQERGFALYPVTD